MEATGKNLGTDGALRWPPGHFRASFPAATLKMIDNLFNSFTCHAVPGLL
jgi:hypothetical protein